MSTLIERRDARKAEAQALADRFNTLNEESKNLRMKKHKFTLISLLKMHNMQS